MLLYAITSRILLADIEAERVESLISLTASWAATTVDFIQIRESDLSDAELLRLASRIVQVVHNVGSPTRVLINSNPKTAVACCPISCRWRPSARRVEPGAISGDLNSNPRRLAIFGRFQCHADH